MPGPSKIPITDLTVPVSKKPKPKHTLAKKFAELRRIHDERNEELYTINTSERPQINSPADAAYILQPFISSLDHEELWILLLNTRNRVLKLVKLYSGSLNSAQVRVGEIFKDAITESASALILAHNHPSGDPTPSPDDVVLTRSVWQAGKLLDIDVLDHLVIGGRNFVSLKERGMGFSD